MTRDPMTAGPDDQIETALNIMLAQGFRHLPVVEGAEVIGIVSIRDLAG
jgi:CBS domain-containing protein